MEKFLNQIQQLLPLITFYPRWAQLFFLASFAMFLVSLLIFVVLYPTFSSRKQQAESTKEFPKEIRQVIEKDLNTISSLTSDLGLSLSSYYSSSVSLRLHLLDYTTANPDFKTYLSDPLTEPLKREVEDVIQRIETLGFSLSAIQRNEFAAACWRRSTSDSGVQGLKFVRENLIRHGFSKTESTIDIADIAGLTQFFSIAANRMREFSFASVLKPVLATNSANIEGVNKSYDHAALRSFIFSGNLIFGFVAQSKNTNQSIVASWGSSMLLDIFRSIPDINDVLLELLARYPNHHEAIQTIQINLDPNVLVSSNFRISIDKIEKRLGLLFLELPLSKNVSK